MKVIINDDKDFSVGRYLNYKKTPLVHSSTGTILNDPINTEDFLQICRNIGLTKEDLESTNTRTYGVIINPDATLEGFTFRKYSEQPPELTPIDTDELLDKIDSLDNKWYSGINKALLHVFTIKPNSKIVDLSIYYRAKYLTNNGVGKLFTLDSIWKETNGVQDVEEFTKITSNYIVEITQEYLIDNQKYYKSFTTSLVEGINLRYNTMIQVKDNSFCIYSGFNISELKIFSANETIY